MVYVEYIPFCLLLHVIFVFGAVMLGLNFQSGAFFCLEFTVALKNVAIKRASMLIGNKWKSLFSSWLIYVFFIVTVVFLNLPCILIMCWFTKHSILFLRHELLLSINKFSSFQLTGELLNHNRC